MNDGAAAVCAKCEEPLSESSPNSDFSLRWLEALPSWLRWIIALPIASIVGVIVVLQLELAGFRDVSSVIMFASAAGVAMFAAAHLAAYAAPSHRRSIGAATVTGVLAAFISTLLFYYIFEYYNRSPSYLRSTVIEYLIVALIAVFATTFALIKNDTRSSESALPHSNLRLPWFLCIFYALLAASTFGVVSGVVSARWPALLPPAAAQSLVSVIGPSIAVTLSADFATAKKMLAAWVTASVLFAGSAVVIAYAFIKLGPFDSMNDFILVAGRFVLDPAATIGGATIGLFAAAHALRTPQPLLTEIEGRATRSP